MVEAEFVYNGGIANIQCNLNDKLKEIFLKFGTKIGKDNLDSFIFLYGANRIDKEKTLEEIINENDKNSNKIRILVTDIENEEEENNNLRSREIICPTCHECIKINIYNYGIYLTECRNHHRIDKKIKDIKEYEYIQNINQKGIICDDCKIVNKSDTYKNAFFICNTCKTNLCPLCKLKHNKEHYIINYEEKHYKCNKHNNLYTSYCDKCKKDLCVLCEQEHINHKIINVGQLIPKDVNECKGKLSQLREGIDKLKEKINEIRDNLGKVVDNIELYYTISNEIINNYENTNINYEILYNVNKINNSNDNFIKEINNINNDDNINNKFKQIYNIYNKIYDKIDEVTFLYKFKEENEKLKIFGKDFVKNNKDKCCIIYEDQKYDLVEKFEPKEKTDNLKIVLRGVKNITDMSSMFEGCSKLLSLPDISILSTSNATNMNSIFSGCSSLLSLPDISNWNTKNVVNMSYMFSGCSSLSSLPEISIWNTSNIKEVNNMFDGCSSLISLPDISNWTIQEINNMNSMFNDCSSLLSLPDISNWNTSNVTDMNSLFSGCSSLLSLPDISNWITSNVTTMNCMFFNCSKL